MNQTSLNLISTQQIMNQTSLNLISTQQIMNQTSLNLISTQQIMNQTSVNLISTQQIMNQTSAYLALSVDSRTAAEQAATTLWCCLCLLLGLLGNCLLISGILNRALKLDTISIWIVLNLSVADLVHMVVTVLPMCITNLAGNVWVLGETLCVAGSVFVAVGLVARIVLVNMFAGHRLLRCMFPFRGSLSTSHSRVIITATALLVTSIFPVWNLVAHFNGYTVAVFWAIGSKCAGWPVQHQTVHRALTVALFGAPCVPLALSNFTLVWFAAKKSRAVKSCPNMKNIFVVLLVTLLMLLTLIPINLINFFKDPVMTSVYFLRFATLFLNVSTFLNPLVFFVTHSSLRHFIMKYFLTQYQIQSRES